MEVTALTHAGNTHGVFLLPITTQFDFEVASERTVPGSVSQRPLRTSVLINNYNHARFLRHCLDSVLSQQPRPDEIIVVDDGSTDESGAILRSYGSTIRLLERSHGRGGPIQNQADSIHAAFTVSTGDILFLLDGDDAFLPGKLGAYLKAFSSGRDVVMVQAPLEKIGEQGQRLGYEFERARHQADYRRHIYSEHELNIYYPTSALAFSRDFLARNLPIDFSDGFPVWPDARLALIAPLQGRVVALPTPYTQWRRHPKSHTVAKALSVYRLVRLNQAYFNAYCRRVGEKLISPWRSAHHRRRWFKHYFIPEWLLQSFRALRWHTLSTAAKQRLIVGPDPAEIERQLDRVSQQVVAGRDQHGRR